MAESTDKNEDFARTDREDIYSKAVRAGKRTYFFDVKATRRNDYYLTLTESKKRFNRDGRFYFEKHKIFLYKEDFDKFSEGLTEVIEYIRNANPEIIPLPEDEGKTAVSEPAEAADTRTAGESVKKAAPEAEESSVQDESAENDDEAEAAGKKGEEVEVGETISNNYTSDVEFEDLEDSQS